MFERTVEVYLPSSSHSKLSGLCKTRWMERHSCFEVLHEMYETLVTFLDAIVPHTNILTWPHKMGVGTGTGTLK